VSCTTCCPSCKGPSCPRCGGRVPGTPPPDADDRRNFHVKSASIVFTAGVNPGDDFTDVVVMTIPAAAAVDVFIQYKNPSTHSTTNPFGTEVWKVFAIQNEVRSQVSKGRASTQAGIGTDGIPENRIFAIRDVPADSFDITLSSVGMNQGDQVFFDVVVISWGREPTGIGPLELSAVIDGQIDGIDYASKVGFIPMGLSGGATWMHFGFNRVTPEGPLATVTPWLTTLGGGVYRTTPPDLTATGDATKCPLQVDGAGNLKVNLAATGGSASVSRSTSAAYEASRVHAGASRLLSVAVSSKAAAAGFIFIFDAASLPINTTLPDYPPIPIAIGNAGGAFVSVDFPEPRVHALGIVVAFSSTAAALTLGSADCWIEAGYT
jgi:hypothetical protein